MSLIVIEGVDASGKSTLLENARVQIPKRYFVLIRHSCRPLSCEQLERFVATSRRASERLDVVVDRHPLISEPIYGPILRGHDLTSEGIWSSASITNYLRQTVARVIYCRPPTTVMLDHIDKNPQLEWVKERFGALLDAYDKRMDELKLAGVPIVWYDWTSYQGTLEDLFFHIPGWHA